MGDSSQCFSLQARIPLGKPHILVVDDDDSVRDLYQRMLNRHGYKVTVVSGGRKRWTSWPRRRSTLSCWTCGCRALEQADKDGIVFLYPPSGKRVAETPVLPTASTLEGNYPNPFNSSTAIPFSLAQEGEVRLGIYDSSGQEVRAVMQRHEKAGSHVVTWDGRDAHGVKVASGVYLCRLSVGDGVWVRKMALLK